MTRSADRSPVVKFLGPSASPSSGGGPFALLALDPATVTPEAIEQALNDRLEQVAAHPEGSTPHAQEVCMALYAAAAQLRDESVREALIERATKPPLEPPKPVLPRAAPAEVGGVQTPFFARPEATPAHDRLKALVLGISSIAVLAVIVLVGVIVMLRSHGMLKPVSTAANSGGVAPSPAPPPSQATGAPSGPLSAVPADKTFPENAKAEQTKSMPFVRTARRDPDELVADLRDLARTAKAEPGAAVEKFAATASPLADWWCDYALPSRRAADSAVLELIMILGPTPKDSAAIVDQLGRWAAPVAPAQPLDSDGVWRATWATGMLTRLSSERELPRGVSAAVNDALNRVLGTSRTDQLTTFEEGARAALIQLASRLVQPDDRSATAQAVTFWIKAAQQVADASALENLLTDALEQILTARPSAEQSVGKFEAVTALAKAIKWPPDGPARKRLLAWLRDDRIGLGDVRVLTAAVAESGAPGVEPTMKLPTGATGDDRTRLRIAYAKAWGMLDPESRVQALEHWHDLLARTAAAPGKNDDPVQVLAEVARAVRLNEAARAIWLGDFGLADTTMHDTQSLVDQAMQGRMTLTPAVPALPPPMNLPKQWFRPPAPNMPRPTSKIWGESFLQAEHNIPVRMQRLADAMELSRPLSRLDAGVLVETALLGSPQRVRLAAIRVVEKFADEREIMEAVLEQLPDAPHVTPVADMLEHVAGTRLPKATDPDFEFVARREIVDRLLAKLIAGTQSAAIDGLASVIGDSYAREASLGSTPDKAGPERAIAGAEQLWVIWKNEALAAPPSASLAAGQEGGVGQIERRLDSRLAVAAGSTQQFVARELALAEVMADIVLREQPGQAKAVQDILADLRRRQRQSDHVFEQMLAAELAMLKLWNIRFPQVISTTSLLPKTGGGA